MKKVGIFTLLILWMIVISFFSSEDGEQSKKRSIGVVSNGIHNIKEIITKDSSSNAISDKKNITGNNSNITSNSNLNTKVINNKKEIESHLHLIRKSAHVIEYFVLGFLCIGFILTYKNKLSWKVVLFSIFLCVLYACFDEIHQLFVPGRTGRIFDVFVDLIGISLGSLFYSYCWTLYKRKRSL